MGGRDHSCERCGHDGFNDPERCNCLGSKELAYLLVCLDEREPRNREFEIWEESKRCLLSQIKDCA
jgi:hypothetical protein